MQQHFIFVLSLIPSLSLSFSSFFSAEKATSGITTTPIAIKSIITLTYCADKDHNHVHTHPHPHELIEDEHADHESDDQNHEGDDHDHDHIAKKAGPNGGRLLTNVEPYAEFFAKPDRSV